MTQPTVARIPTALLVFSALLITSPLAALTVSFTGEEVTIRDVAPGATIAWNAVLAEPYNSSLLRTSSRGIVTDEDGDGVIRLSPDRGVPQASMWAIVDLGTGQHVVTSPVPELVSEFPLEANFRHLATPAVDRGWVTAMVARPGVGAWTLEMTEGSSRDADHSSDARLTMNPDNFEPLQRSGESPRGLRPGDVMIILDWQTLEHAVARIGR